MYTPNHEYTIMEHTTNTKSQLAKLMATENIRIEHSNVATASFRLDTRTLTCPIWNDMSGHLYDLLMGHEVGHALETPEEGWHKAIVPFGKTSSYKHFLNVIEDVRIEKKIKRRYPGIRNSFIKGYTELMERDFFGIKETNINKLFLIDRINIFFKCGYAVDINFTDEEQTYVDMVDTIETWEDVVRVTDIIWKYSKNEQQDLTESSYKDSMDSFKSDPEDTEESGESEGYSESDEDGESNDSENGDSENTDKEMYEVDKLKSESAKSEGEAKDGNVEEQSSAISDTSGDTEEDKKTNEEFQPSCITDENFRNNEFQLLDSKAFPYIYFTVPKVNLNNIIVNGETVNKQIDEYYIRWQRLIDERNCNDLVSNFKSINGRYVSMLAKEFEMRKAADSFAKKKVSESGDLDINKIHRYKTEDNIFRKIMKLPKGKSHGLVMLLDKSGSMENSMKGAIEQIIVLAMFCRKVNIPFVAYGFNEKHSESDCFTFKDTDMLLGKLVLREIISSKMTASQFNKSIKNQLILSDNYSRDYNHKILPPQEYLGATPLNEALIASRDILVNLKREYNLDMVNLIVVHDGDADNKWNRKDGVRFFTNNTNPVLRDEKYKIEIPLIRDRRGITSSLMKLITKTTGAKVMGLYIAESATQTKRAIMSYYQYKDGSKIIPKEDSNSGYIERKRYESYQSVALELRKNLIKNKFLESYTEGYTRFFFIPGGKDLNIEDEEININGKITTSKLTTAFKKMNNSKKVSRTMVSRFIELIAKQ